MRGLGAVQRLSLGLQPPCSPGCSAPAPPRQGPEPTAGLGSDGCRHRKTQNFRTGYLGTLLRACESARRSASMPDCLLPRRDARMAPTAEHGARSHGATA